MSSWGVGNEWHARAWPKSETRGALDSDWGNMVGEGYARTEGLGAVCAWCHVAIEWVDVCLDGAWGWVP